MNLILIIAMIAVIVGWLKQKIAVLTLVRYMQTKGYQPPNDDETKACTRYVIEHLIGRKTWDGDK